MGSKIISVSGKGGVGKSTLLVLLLKYVLEKRDENGLNDILIIDADPDANIGDLIGKQVSFNQTVGGKMSDLKKKIARREIPPNMPKNTIIESEIFQTLIEMEDFDLLEMGRTEGSGCYCSVNNVIKKVIDTLSENYDLTLIDSPAGLEHFARKMGRNVSDLIIVTDPSKMGIHTIKRIIDVSQEVELKFKNIFILGNRFSENLKSVLENELKKISQNNIKLLGLVPNDEKISEINITGGSLLDLSNDNPTYQKAKELFSKIL
ncbi:MAG: ATP-binding protein [Promethearchaeota archaeon]|nr:MAG: ATP-binding protein [Candidatus Lokiarchaeota archaeon]